MWQLLRAGFFDSHMCSRNHSTLLKFVNKANKVFPLMERHFRIPRRRWNDIHLDVTEACLEVVNVIMLCRTRTNERFICERLFAGLLPRKSGSLAGYSMWDFWQAQWQWERIFSQYFSCPPSVSFHQWSGM